MLPRACTRTRSCTLTGAESARNSRAPICSTGEWLRRQRRRREAREQLRTARDMLEAMGMDAFADRARRELRATGETARKRTAVTPRDEELTAQEAQIARLAREGLSNPEIGTRLFISARTVQYHLGNVFTKLGIASRSQLSHALL
jgi:DNA-binding NarL/FixJ family response regulator